MAHNVHPQMWDDEKFLSFDDTTRVLWLCLLTGPHRKALPGLFRASVLELADTLKRPPELVQDSMSLLEREGMVNHDPLARVVCLPNAPKWANRPHPNQLVAWFTQWRDLPTCELKFIHVPRLKALVDPEHARLPVKNAWNNTFGMVAKGTPVRQGYIEPAGTESLPHTPSLNRSDLDLYQRLSVDDVRMAGSGSANVRGSRRNGLANSNAASKANRKTNAEESFVAAPAAVEDGVSGSSDPEELVTESHPELPATPSKKSSQKSNRSNVAQTWSKPTSEDRTLSQNEEHQIDKSSNSPLRSSDQKKGVVETDGVKKTQPSKSVKSYNSANQVLQISSRDELPDFCRPRSKRKRSPSPLG